MECDYVISVVEPSGPSVPRRNKLSSVQFLLFERGIHDRTPSVRSGRRFTRKLRIVYKLLSIRIVDVVRTERLYRNTVSRDSNI
jgi:hypothetical protein